MIAPTGAAMGQRRVAVARLARALALLAAAACAGGSPPRCELRDLEGNVHAPLAVEDARAHVLLFLATDCPIANASAPAVHALRAAFEPRGVRFYLVHVQTDLEEAAVAAHARAFGHRGPVLIDRRHDLVRATGVAAVPEAAVLDRAGTLAYRGRIDDLFGDVGKKRPAARRHDLRDALAAIVEGREVEVARTEPVGCFIEPVPRR